MEHEVPSRCNDETMDIIDYEDSDQEDGELPDLLTFPLLIYLLVFVSRFSLQGDGIRGLHNSFYVVKVCGVMLGRSLATGKHFKTGLVGYHVNDDDWMICDDGCCSRKQTWSMA
ncbi:hypothetical protein Tco_1474769 [Tanacetum coccineum]